VVLLALLGGVTACSAPPPAVSMSADEIIAMIERDTGGDDSAVSTRKLVVQRAGGEVDELTLFLVRRTDGSRVLVDHTGQRYEPDLDAFRAENHLLTEADTITVAEGFPDTPDVTVSGHTGAATWGWWPAGGAALVVLALVFAIGVRRRRAARGSAG